MAFSVIHGAGREVDSARADVSRISDRAINLRNELVKSGARIVGIAIGPDGVDIDWHPAGADADPDLPPIRASIIHAATLVLVDQADLEDDELEEIPVLLDAPAIASLEAEAAAVGVISLDAWRASREH